MMATIASSTSTIYENLSDTHSPGNSDDLKLEDSGTYDADSRSNSHEKIASCSVSPELYPSHQDDGKHIYTNIREMNELNSRPYPPVPNITDIPRRDLNNGWLEYETEAGRTYFYNSETGKSQWIPPRFIRTPAQIQALLQSTRTGVEEQSLTKSAIYEDSHSIQDDLSLDVSSSPKVDNLDDAMIETMIFLERKYSYDQGIRSVPPSTTHHHATASSDDAAILSSFHVQCLQNPLCANLKQSSKERKNQTAEAPTVDQCQYSSKRNCLLKSVPLPQVLPSTSSGNLVCADTGTQSLDRGYPRAERESMSCYNVCDRRGSGSYHNESRESVRTIKCGNMEFVESTDQIRSKKRDWIVNFMYLTSAHLIFYKDEKSAEKHGNHYAAPRGVCDLKGASVSWLVMEKEKRKRKIIQGKLVLFCPEVSLLFASDLP
ncbi:WW domain protein [Dictyocaulus viviparus]|uniref:WW domain protein n=1 Tax=Dictyocaulus viviparus TaxID=29172 RepID=A0A0D8YE65_DICVI|nr:WW domain protein [Dictyocaulus viviparus]